MGVIANFALMGLSVGVLAMVLHKLTGLNPMKWGYDTTGMVLGGIKTAGADIGGN